MRTGPPAAGARARQAQPVPAHHGTARRRLPPAAVGLHADRLVRHAGFRAARHGGQYQPGRPRCRASCPPIDLCVRAARALQQATGCAPGRPHPADKAAFRPRRAWAAARPMRPACLIALNRLGPRLSRHELITIGLGLGADVPFFIGGRNAWVEGVGERLTPVSLPPAARFAVVKPATGASTQSHFQRRRLAATRHKNCYNPRLCCKRQIWATKENGSVDSCDLQKILAFGHNDLQPVAQMAVSRCGAVSGLVVGPRSARPHDRFGNSGVCAAAAGSGPVRCTGRLDGPRMQQHGCTSIAGLVYRVESERARSPGSGCVTCDIFWVSVRGASLHRCPA